MAKIDFKENGSKGVESSKISAHGAQEYAENKQPIIVGPFSPAKALLQMVERFGDQLSASDLRALDSDQWYVSSLAEQWSEVTSNLSVFISDDHHKAKNGKSSIGLYATCSQSTPNLLLLISRGFEEIDCLIRLNEITQERLNDLKGESA